MSLIKLTQKEHDITVIPDKHNTGLIDDSILTIADTEGTYGDVFVRASGTGNSKLGIDFWYRYHGADVQLEVNNIQYTKQVEILNAGKINDTDGYNVLITFTNCDFLGGFLAAPNMYNIDIVFINCKFSKTATYSNMTFINCAFTKTQGDGLKPLRNVLVQNCYMYDMLTDVVGEQSHVDAVQFTGYSGIDIENVQFENVRVELPSLIISGQTAGSIINACLMLQPELSNANNLTFSNCYINGGGYPLYAYPKNKTISNTLFENIYIGDHRSFGLIYPTTSPDTTFTNVISTPKLYCGSVYQDTVTHLTVSNDTYIERTLRVVTNLGYSDYIIPKCIEKSEVIENVTSFEDFPFDLDVELALNIDYIIAYDITDGIPINPNDHIRFVNFTENDVYLPATNSITPTYIGKVKADLIECDVSGTPTVGGGYVKQYTSPAIYRVSNITSELTTDHFDRTDPSALEAVVLDKATLSENDNNQLFINLPKWLMHKGNVKPNASNTGIIDASVLSPASGRIRLYNDVTHIENLDLVGYITSEKDGGTIANCRIKPDIETRLYSIQFYAASDNIIIENCELGDDTVFVKASMLGGPGSYTLRHCYLHGSQSDGVKFSSNCVIEYNYITSLGHSLTAHADGLQTVGGSNIVIRGNNIDIPSGLIGQVSNACVFLKAENEAIDNVLIENNWFNGGGYTIYCIDDDYPTTNVVIRNNYFGRDYNFGLLAATPGSYTWINNRWADTGEIIPDPYS